MSRSEEKKSTKKAHKEEKSTKHEKSDKTSDKSKSSRKEKTSKKDSKKESSKESKKDSKKDSKSASVAAKPVSVFSATPTAFDPSISSLFANSLGPSKPDTSAPTVDNDDDDDDDELMDVDGDEVDDVQEEDDEILSEVDEEIDDDSDQDQEEGARAAAAILTDGNNDRKRKRKDKQDNLEDVYMDRLARDEEKAAAKQKEERAAKRQKKAQEDGADSADQVDDSDAAADSDSEDAGTPPMHESLMPDTTSDLAKSQRTVFLGNVSSDAITSKSAEKTLRNHLSSFFSSLDAPAKDQPKHAIESIRFRSTAFASAIPKKAAFAKKELMEATTKSTNAYVVYSSSQLSREAARRLNGTVVLDRHLRVDEVAHPAKVDHKRCIFVGNLGFVDDETNIDKANEEEGIQKRKGNKIPSDVEEGLWRTFATCGKVESVRVVRDSKTRVGKGFAYVQFDDENAVEAALLLNEKRFPPMLPRKLRVVRAKAIKRNAKPGQSNTARPPTHTRSARAGGVYNPKMTSQEQSNLGRAGKLFGRAAAAQLHRGGKDAPANAIKGPEKFIFEGHRASNKNGKTGLKFGKKGKPGSKASKSSKSRAAAWKGKNK